MKVIINEEQFNRVILKEEINNDLLIEGKLNDIFKKFNITQIKKELKERLDIDETSTKMEVAKKLMKYIYNLNLKLLKYELGAVLGGFIFYFLSIVLDLAGVEPFVTDGEPTIPHFILWGAGALLNVIRVVRKDLKEEIEYQNLRVKLDRQGLTRMPDPESLPETMEILNLETNDIEELDLTGYHRFNNLFLLNLTNNPIRRINMDSILMGLPSGLHRIVLSYDKDYISDEEIRNFENFVHGISSEVMIDYHPINMEYI